MHILLVEDHAESRDVLSNLLTHCGHEVTTAANMQDALILLDHLRFEVLLSDIGLPDGSGLELLAEARRRQPWKKTVALTGHEQADERELGLRAGFDEYLTKPFDFHHLRSLLAPTLEARVASHPFFEGMEAPHLRILTDCAMAKNFAEDDYLFRQGDFANRFYLIEEGTVVLEALDSEGHTVAIEEVGPEKLVGWSWLFPPYLWHFDARATKATKALFFYGTILREACAKDSSLGYELFRRMSQVMLERLQAARGRVLARHSGPKRASAFLDPRD